MATEEEIIHIGIVLRGQGRFREAIDHLEQNFSSIGEDLQLNALLEMFKSAREAGNAELARHYAAKVAAIEPDVPSIQGFV